MFGSLVGESEGKIRAALKIIDAFSPCVLFIDEFEKGISGIQSSGQTDSGVGSKVYGTFLTWLSDHKSRVFVVATCNDISKIPPEFLRAERWDAIFFVDLPNGRERKTIFEIYKKQFNIKEEFGAVNMDGWSGAEIKSLCRISAMLKSSLKDAAKYVMPLSQSMGEKINGLREWASTRTIPASLPEDDGGGAMGKRKLTTN
jgi:SpoVK/Ycf46/Vps4 family AAA+-type ATPase